MNGMHYNYFSSFQILKFYNYGVFAICNINSFVGVTKEKGNRESLNIHHQDSDLGMWHLQINVCFAYWNEDH